MQMIILMLKHARLCLRIKALGEPGKREFYVKYMKNTHTTHTRLCFISLSCTLVYLSPPFLERAKLEQCDAKNTNTENTNNRAAEGEWQRYAVPDSPDAQLCHSLSLGLYLCRSHCR